MLFRSKPVKKPKKEKKKGEKSKYKKKREPESELFSEEPTESISDNYDGYYNDVTPKDSVMLHQGLDKTMVKKLVILIGCVIIAITLCVVALVLLS